MGLIFVIVNLLDVLFVFVQCWIDVVYFFLQIVCFICELVEVCIVDIKFGWRSLFGVLRAVKIEYTVNEEVNDVRQRYVVVVLDVFEVYLVIDNILVFANVIVDCILCLLKYIRGLGMYSLLYFIKQENVYMCRKYVLCNICLINENLYLK